MSPSPRPRVFLDISIDGTSAGRLVIELFNDKTPKTCENFLQLCTSGYEGKTYANCPFHRVIDEFMIQGGDIERGDGTGTVSIYDGKEFEDENLDWRKMDAAGLVCSANRGPKTNGSQFFITLDETPHLDGKHTVFGRLVTGVDLLHSIAKVPVDNDDRPQEPVLISRCGELERKRKRQDELSADAIHAEGGRGRPRRSDGDDMLMSGMRCPDQGRRPSDNIVDEGLRGRPRKRSKQRNSQIDEEMLSSTQHSPVKMHKRKRSASPSREPEDRGKEQSPARRRRRSLPNQYNDSSQRERRDHQHREREYDRRPGRREHDDRDDRRYRDRQGDRYRGPDRWQPHDGRISNDDRGSSDSGVKFKGRGVMKYREPGRLS